MSRLDRNVEKHLASTGDNLQDSCSPNTKLIMKRKRTSEDDLALQRALARKEGKLIL